MAEFIDMSLHEDVGKEIERGLPISNNLESLTDFSLFVKPDAPILNDFKSDSCLNLQKSENILNDGDSIKVNEELKLLLMTKNISEMLSSLHEQKLKLVNMQLKKVGKGVNISREEMENFIEETNSKFLKYHKTYRESMSFLEEFLQNLKNKRNNSNAQKVYREQLCISYTISEEELASYISIIDSSKRHFQEFECSLKNDLEICCEDCDNTFKSIKGTINKAEFACQELTSVAKKLLNYE